MTYAKSQTILAADYNNNVIQSLYGTGSGDKGYGQSALSFPNIATGSKILASTWSNYRSACALIASHQGTATTLLPPAPTFVTGQQVIAEVPATTAYDLPTFMTTVTNNRFNTNSGSSMTLTSNAYSNTRATTWGSGNSSITAVFNATWSSEDQARFFFNSGGQIRLLISQPTGTTQDNEWNTILSTYVGTFTLLAQSSTKTGTKGTVAGSTGFYGLTDTLATLYNGAHIGDAGAYANNDVIIQAKRLNFVGVNGGNGNGVQFSITLTDEHTSGFFDQVAAGTSVSASHLRATVVLSGITAPTYATITNF